MTNPGTAILPNGYGPLLTTAVSRVLGQNPTRSGLIFFNPSTIKVAFCPGDGILLVPVVDGPGSMTLSQYGYVVLDTAVVTSSWSAVAASGGAVPFTIWEW